MYCRARCLRPGHPVFVGWIHSAVWPCYSFSNMKPGLSINYGNLLGVVVCIKDTVNAYAFGSGGLYIEQRTALSDVKQGASIGAKWVRKPKKSWVSLWPVCSWGFHVDCSWGYFQRNVAVFWALGTFSVACWDSYPGFYISTFTSDRRHFNHSEKSQGWQATGVILSWGNF